MIIQIDRNNRKGVFMKADLIVRIRNNIQFGEPCTFDEALFWKMFWCDKRASKDCIRALERRRLRRYKSGFESTNSLYNNRGSSCQYRENQEERRRTPPICC